MRTITTTILAASAGLALFALPAAAETMMYKATLAASQEVPPVNSKGTGNVDATYDSSTKKLSWKGSYSGLSGPATGAHFHGPAEAGKNAGVAVPADAAKSPFEGSATLTDAQAADLTSGKWYFNIHTAENKGGEIRGQVTKK
ncbi:MAG: CHRD domain-containing protein [Beijerinckiaceae bacterium]